MALSNVRTQACPDLDGIVPREVLARADAQAPTADITPLACNVVWLKPRKEVPTSVESAGVLDGHVPNAAVPDVVCTDWKVAPIRLLPERLITVGRIRFGHLVAALCLTLLPLAGLALITPTSFGNADIALTDTDVLTVELVSVEAAAEDQAPSQPAQESVALPTAPPEAVPSEGLPASEQPAAAEPEPQPAVPEEPVDIVEAEQPAPEDPVETESSAAPVELPVPSPAVELPDALPEVVQPQPREKPPTVTTVVRETKKARPVKHAQQRGSRRLGETKSVKPRSIASLASKPATHATAARALRSYLGRIRSIALGRLPRGGLSGRYAVSFTIGAGGGASGISVSGPDAGGRARVAAVARGGFPPPPAGPVRVTIPITFKAGGS